MGRPKSPKSGASGRGSGRPKASPRAKTGAKEESFIDAFIALLRSRKIRAPQGLAAATPEAYASQPASFVQRLASLPDRDLKVYAERIAGHARRQADRAKAGWDASPLIAELRRRGLKEPPTPLRVVGASVSLARPLKNWSDDEVLHAATEWSRLGRG